MTRMYQDIRVSKGLSGEFREFLQTKPPPIPPYDFNVRVLATANWPFTGVNKDKIEYPAEVNFFFSIPPPL